MSQSTLPLKYLKIYTQNYYLHTVNDESQLYIPIILKVMFKDIAKITIQRLNAWTFPLKSEQIKSNLKFR